MSDNKIVNVEPYHNPNEGRVIFNENFQRVKNRFEEPYTSIVLDDENGYDDLNLSGHSNFIVYTEGLEVSLNINGFVPELNGQVIILTYLGIAKTMNLQGNRTSSAYPIAIDSEVRVIKNNSVILKYDHINTVWRIISKP